jgi:hypothetical protein
MYHEKKKEKRKQPSMAEQLKTKTDHSCQPCRSPLVAVKKESAALSSASEHVRRLREAQQGPPLHGRLWHKFIF